MVFVCFYLSQSFNFQFPELDVMSVNCFSSSSHSFHFARFILWKWWHIKIWQQISSLLGACLWLHTLNVMKISVCFIIFVTNKRRKIENRFKWKISHSKISICVHEIDKRLDAEALIQANIWIPFNWFSVLK